MYGIKYCRILDCQKGYRNEIWPVVTDGGQMINITFFKREPGIVDRINRADKVSEYLSDLGLPVRVRIDPRVLVVKSGAIVTNVGIYNYLPGNTIPWEAYTMKHIKALGLMMSDMHAKLSDAPQTNLPSVYNEYLEILRSMKVYFDMQGVKIAMETKLGLKLDGGMLKKYEDILRKYSGLSGQIPLHMDFVRGNILFEGSNISGILDFEKTALGHNIVDIARTLAFLLVDCKYKSADKVYKYFVYSGYQKRGQTKDIGDDEDSDVFVGMFLIHDFYKFLLHNPYESLGQNEHFIRTRDVLVARGIIAG